jgi:hypothetical protein
MIWASLYLSVALGTSPPGSWNVVTPKEWSRKGSELAHSTLYNDVGAINQICNWIAEAEEV